MQFEEKIKNMSIFLNVFKKKSMENIVEVVEELDDKKTLEHEIDLLIKNGNESQLESISRSGVLVSFEQLKTIIFKNSSLLFSIDLAPTVILYKNEIKIFLLDEFKKMAACKLGSEKTRFQAMLFAKVAYFVYFTGIPDNFTMIEISRLYNDSLTIKKMDLTYNYDLKHEACQNIHSHHIEVEYNRLNKTYIDELVQKSLPKNSLHVNQENAIDSFIENLEIDNLKNVLKEIKSLFSDLNSIQLNSQQKFELENIYIKRFPQVIKEYLDISKEYKKEMSHQADNPDNLITDSLEKIKEKLSMIKNGAQEEKLLQMKITNRYLNSIL